MSFALRLAPAALVVASVLLANCAPSRARAIREDKSITLGLPGASYRPHGTVGIGATIEAASSDLALDTRTESEQKADDLDEDVYARDVKKETFGVKPFVQYFPWDTSAFFFGLGAAIYNNKYSYSEAQNTLGLAGEPTFTEVEYSSRTNYVTLPVGFAWIWENGFSLTLDVGPKIYASGSGEMTKTGEDEDVNVAMRDRTVDAIERDEKQSYLFSTFATTMIGWSF